MSIQTIIVYCDFDNSLFIYMIFPALLYDYHFCHFLLLMEEIKTFLNKKKGLMSQSGFFLNQKDRKTEDENTAKKSLLVACCKEMPKFVFVFREKISNFLSR
jgi:hypothetical protein